MKNNKGIGMNEILRNFLRINDLGGLGLSFPGEVNEYGEKLNNGFSLKYLDTPTPRGMRGNYGILCKDGVPISKEIFRVGGLSTGYKDGYCPLILYKPDNSKEGYDFGTHVIVDETGKVCLSAGSKFSKYPYHLKGIVATMDGSYYNLKTGEMILNGEYSSNSYISQTTVKSDSYVFIEGRLNNVNVVYRIEFKTGECVVIN